MGDFRRFQKEKRTVVRRILTSPFTYCVLTGLCWCLVYLISFLGGCRGYHLAVMMFPAGLVPVIFAAVFTLTVLVLGISDIVARRRIIVSILLILLTVGFWYTPRLWKHSPFLLGFKCKVLRESSPEELRQIASAARKFLSRNDYLVGPGSRLEEYRDKERWEKMPKSKILSSVPYVCIGIDDNACVDLSWGSALVGHRGIRIAEKTVAKYGYDHDYIPLEEDIAVYTSD